MQTNELLELVRRQPFTPLRLHVSERESYDINQSDQIIVLRGAVDIGVSEQGRHGDVADRVDRVSLSHVIRAEFLPAESTEQTN